MYDLIIIGGGPAGYHGALKAAAAGLNTALVSDGKPGGVCLHSGCIPSKTVLHSTKLAMDHADYAVYGGPHPVDLPVLKERTHGIIKTLGKGIEFQLNRAGVELFNAEAEILEKRDSLFAVKAGSNVILAKHLLLATGSQERPLEVPGVEKAHLTNVTTLLESEQPPRSLLVIGAGGVGLELALIFARCGTEVTIVEKADRIAPHFDPDLSRVLQWAVAGEKITIHTETVVETIHNHSVTLKHGDETFTIQAEQILPAMGRIPHLSIPGAVHLNLEKSGVAVKVDEKQQTSHRNCYAAGDITGEPMLAHSAYYETEVAVAAIAGKLIASMREVFVPSVLYTTPELASVGVTEREAKAHEIPIIVKKRPLGSNGRFLAETSGERGICKVILHAESKAILGIHLACPEASEVITAATIMVQQKLTANDLASIIFPHPTIGEILKQTIVEE